MGVIWTLAVRRRSLYVKMNPARILLACLLLGLALAAVACGGGDDSNKGPSNNESYAEGKVRMEIEYLDTGLLKGHSYADAVSGYKVAAIKVQAVDHKSVGWTVLEPETTGVGSASVKDFFEVVLQELPRDKQLTLTTTVTFQDGSGNKVDREAADKWPP